ncbi:fibronectin type III domain-containing protein [Streptacidiphilus sp. 4-A2]|nr:fibronectin type III domain-containing protein [Streptacidiphilus sp. 4-A2]
MAPVQPRRLRRDLHRRGLHRLRGGQPLAGAHRRARGVRRRARRHRRRPVDAGHHAGRGRPGRADHRAGLGQQHSGRGRRLDPRPGRQLLHPADVGDGAVRPAGQRHLQRQRRGHPERRLPDLRHLPGQQAVRPTKVTVTGTTSTTASLSWTAPAGSPTGYKILRNGTQVGTSTGTSYTDTGLTASTGYSYTVEAYNSAGTSAASAAVTATTSAPGVAPNAPTGLTAGTVTTSTVPLSWTAAGTSGSYPVAGYYVLRNGTRVATTTGTSYTDTGLTPGTGYSYTVEAYDTDGDVSAASTAVAATTATGYTQTVDVTVPVNTAATGDGVYLDGNFSVLGNGGGDWAASGSR